MARFYVPQPRVEQGTLKVEGEEVKHIRKVLRLKEGDEITVFDGLGKELKGTIVEEGLSSVAIRIEHVISSRKDSPLEVTLAQSLLKGEKMDYLIQKATELGVQDIIPFISSRSVPFLEKSKRLRRHHRWEKIAVEASKQCGRTIIPKIEPVQDFSEMLRGAAQNALRLILWEKEGMKLKEILGRSKERQEFFFVVGPEGGFSQREIEEGKRAGFIPVTLGERILRAETASLCFLSILQYEQGDIG
jgi:16S rRNA (uracil1498-N3)-methyltransferase